MKSSTYYFHIKTKILANFQICISVPLKESIFTRVFVKRPTSDFRHKGNLSDGVFIRMRLNKNVSKAKERLGFRDSKF